MPDTPKDKKQDNYSTWWLLAIAFTMVIVGIINAKAGFISTGWSTKSQHETYNSGWYFIFIGLLLSAGCILRLRNKN